MPPKKPGTPPRPPESKATQNEWPAVDLETTPAKTKPKKHFPLLKFDLRSRGQGVPKKKVSDTPRSTDDE